jgi:alpha-glucosidase/lysosomal alpha-glucosidase
MEAVHYGNVLELNVHELFSTLQNQATYEFLKTKSPLPFILTRSSTFGTGQFSAHWTGDNGAEWDFLRWSIAGNFNFQIFGMPFVGADICGFMGSTTAELCSRWIQIGALYPFTRNHNQDMSRDQEPWQFDKRQDGDWGPKVVATYRASVKFRYSVLKWFYSLFIKNAGAGSVWKPLIFEFPNEEVLYDSKYNEDQFLIGPGLMVAPGLYEGRQEVDAYFPEESWFDFFSGKKVIDAKTAKRNMRINAPFSAPPPMFLREGHVVHVQDVVGVLTTTQLNDEFELAIALSPQDENNWSAKGNIMGVKEFDDNTISERCVQKNCLYDINVKAESQVQGTIMAEIQFLAQDSNQVLDDLGIFHLAFYGVPLKFIEEDDRKIGYAIVEVFNSSNESVQGPFILEAGSKEDGAFEIPLGRVIRIFNGYFFRIQIML